jgi:L-ascorbate metabolism protein UlaG (beta-lactamase superfamily)
MSAMFDGYSTSRYTGPVSDHFDGRRFVNQQSDASARLGHIVRRAMTARLKLRRDYRHLEPGVPPPDRIGRGDLRVTNVNHATILIQMDGLNILTDPVWSLRVGPVSWAGPKRVRPPGLRFEDLPPIHAVLISHNHYDHLDVRTLQRIWNVHKPRLVTGLGNAAILEAAGMRDARELDWWQGLALSRHVCVTAVPAHHFSARGLRDRDRTLWNGFVLEGPSGTVYFAGDTGPGPHFAQIRRRHGRPRLALLPIGPFRPEWFMSRVHLSPTGAVRAHQALGAKTSVAIHYGTFRLGDEDPDEPVERLASAIARDGNPRFVALPFGQAHSVAA